MSKMISSHFFSVFGPSLKISSVVCNWCGIVGESKHGVIAACNDACRQHDTRCRSASKSGHLLAVEELPKTGDRKKWAITCARCKCSTNYVGNYFTDDPLAWLFSHGTSKVCPGGGTSSVTVPPIPSPIDSAADAVPYGGGCDVIGESTGGPVLIALHAQLTLRDIARLLQGQRVSVSVTPSTTMLLSI